MTPFPSFHLQAMDVYGLSGPLSKEQKHGSSITTSAHMISRFQKKTPKHRIYIYMQIQGVTRVLGVGCDTNSYSHRVFSYSNWNSKRVHGKLFRINVTEVHVWFRGGGTTGFLDALMEDSLHQLMWRLSHGFFLGVFMCNREVNAHQWYWRN